MTIITKEVREALARLRRVHNGSMSDAYPGASQDMQLSLFFGDINMMARVMLALFHDGMPEPVEMHRIVAPNTTPLWWDAPDFSQEKMRQVQDDLDSDAYAVRGLFIPLARLSPGDGSEGGA